MSGCDKAKEDQKQQVPYDQAEDKYKVFMSDSFVN